MPNQRLFCVRSEGNGKCIIREFVWRYFLINKRVAQISKVSSQFIPINSGFESQLVAGGFAIGKVVCYVGLACHQQRCFIVILFNPSVRSFQFIIVI